MVSSSSRSLTQRESFLPRCHVKSNKIANLLHESFLSDPVHVQAFEHGQVLSFLGLGQQDSRTALTDTLQNLRYSLEVADVKYG